MGNLIFCYEWICYGHIKPKFIIFVRLRRRHMSLISNIEIKKVKSLQQKKFRDEYGLFVVEGEKMVAEAAASPFKVERIFRKDEIGEDAMKRISSLSTPSPVLALVRKPEDIRIEDVAVLEDVFSEGGLYLGLDSIRDPGNLGTILRIADWFGIKAVFAEKDTVDVFNPKVVQATMGAVFRVKMHYVDLKDAARAILSKGGKVYGTFLDGRNIYDRELDNGGTNPSMIVIGNESDGISAQMSSLVSDRLYIPPYPAGQPGSESLNAAVATALAVAEFRRRIL